MSTPSRITYIIGSLAVIGLSFWGTLAVFDYLDNPNRAATSPVLAAPVASATKPTPSTTARPSLNPVTQPSTVSVTTGPQTQQGKGENLVWPSENFSHANWQRLNNVKVETDVDLAPNGEKTASRLVESTNNGRHVIQTILGGTRPGAVYTLSLYVKPTTRSGVMFELRDGPPGKYGTALFDLQNRTTTKAGNVMDAKVEVMENGWYRCWAAMPYDTNQVVLAFSPLEPGGGYSYKGDGRSGLLIWGAQFEPASQPNAYVATVTAPRT